ncbi:hypothetical protein BDZ89DRAFT_995649 [Hymenopellis radicata]|nr:hypothetical protein BDZ89DRAFT_995649 [Hymenopellis radicata]
MGATALVAIALFNGERRAPEWQDFVGIVLLLFIDSAIESSGGMVSLKIGDIVLADCRLTEAINVCIDQTALTGEFLPQSKKSEDQCSGSTRQQGEAEKDFRSNWLLVFLETVIRFLLPPTMLSSSLATRTENQDAIDVSVVQAIRHFPRSCRYQALSSFVDFEPFTLSTSTRKSSTMRNLPTGSGASPRVLITVPSLSSAPIGPLP